MKYSPELATDYSQKREQFNETDEVLVGAKELQIVEMRCQMKILFQ